MTGGPPPFPHTWRSAADRWPHHVALELPGTRRAITYAELHGEATAVAERLAADGVRAGHLVGLRLADRRAFCAGLLGTWLAGAVPVPLDPTAPDAYVHALERRVGVATSVVGGRGDGDAGGDGGVRTTGPVGLRTAPTVTAGLAYVIHTSGSTGTPKPVALSHRALASYCRAFVEATGLGEHDRFLQLAPVTFDVVFEELLPIWSVGGTSVLSPGTPDDPGRLLDDIEARGVTVVELTTVYWQLLVRHLRQPGVRVPRCLRLLLMGGELAPRHLLQESIDRGLPLAHVYGVTEAGITSTIAFLQPGGPVTASWVGRPLPNSAIAVVDETGHVLPDGEVGEVWIGGDSLADGYLHDPGATAARFVVVPAPSGATARWYRTGDAGRVVDGALEVLGRLDAQVKVNGARVDPAEVETALASLPMVAEAAVVPVGHAGLATRLVGFVTAAATADDDLGRRARNALADRLPPHLVPARVLVLDALPVTAHGKVDRARLARSWHDVDVPEMPEATASERLVAAAWASAIGRPPASLDEGFFDSGGDSLALLSLVVFLEERGFTVTPTDCLVHPTVRAMAALLDGTTEAGPDASAAEHDARRREHLSRRRRARRGAA